MNKSGRLSVVLFLMLVSLVTLTCFVGFWLNEQYREEKQELTKKLELNMADSQRQLVDSLLFKKFIQPILWDSLQTNLTFTPDSNHGEVETLKGIENAEAMATTPHKKIAMKNIRLELNVNDSVFKNSLGASGGKMKKTLTIVSGDHAGVKKKGHRIV